MIPSACSSSFDSSLTIYLPKEPIVNNRTYKAFKKYFLSYVDSLEGNNVCQILKIVAADFDDKHALLYQKIVKLAWKHQICLIDTRSELAVSSYLDCLLNGLAPKSSVEDGRLYYNQKFCVNMLISLTFDLIRKRKIVHYLDKLIEAYAKCSIELESDSLKAALENGPDNFTAVLSTQLCQNENFLKDNFLDAVRYCFPRVNEGVVLSCYDRLITCFSRLSNEKTALLLHELFKAHFRLFINTLVEKGFFENLPVRVALAEAMICVDPLYFAEHFLYLFSEEEIVFDLEFSETLNSLLNDLLYKFGGKLEGREFYFKLVYLYLQQWKEKPRLRTSGSQLLEIFLGEKAEGKPLSIDSDLPKDTPLWREVRSLSRPGGDLRLFKLDGDFDGELLRTEYAKKHREDLKNMSITPELYFLLFPALVNVSNDYLFSMWWAPVLGYIYYKGPSGTFAFFPERTTVLNQWKEVLADARAKNVYQNLSIAETDGTITAEEYIALFMKYDVILSSTTEFIHDHQFHLLRTINAILKSTAGEYLDSLNRARNCISDVLVRIQVERSKDSSTKNEKMLQILEFTLGVFADTYSIRDNVEDRNQFIEAVFFGKMVLNIWKGDFWRHVFREYDISHDLYSAEDIQLYWNSIVRGIRTDLDSAFLFVSEVAEPTITYKRRRL